MTAQLYHVHADIPRLVLVVGVGEKVESTVLVNKLLVRFHVSKTNQLLAIPQLQKWTCDGARESSTNSCCHLNEAHQTESIYY